MNKKLFKLKKTLTRRKTPREKFRFGALIGFIAGAIFCIIPFLSESAEEYLSDVVFATLIITMSPGAGVFWIVIVALIAGFSYMFDWQRVLGIAFGFFGTILLAFYLSPLFD